MAIRHVVTATVLCASFFSMSNASALDLEREQLLNLYHGVAAEVPRYRLPMNGMADNGNDLPAQGFEPVQDSDYQVGVFSGDYADEILVQQLGRSIPVQRFHEEDEDSYGVYLQGRF